MKNTRGRIRRAAVAFVVGAVTLLPISAMAAPVVDAGQHLAGAEKPDTGKPDRDESNQGKPANQGDTDAPGNSGNAPGQSDGDGTPPGNSGNAPGQSSDTDAPGNSGNAPGQSDDGAAPGNSGNAPGQSDDGAAPGNSGNAPGQSDDGAAPGNSGNAPGQSDDGAAPGNSGNAPGHTGTAPGLMIDRPEPSDPGPMGPPAVTPSGVVPRSGGLGTLDAARLGDGLGAAVLMFDVDGSDPIEVLVTPATPQGTGLAGSVLSALSPVVPPGVAEVLSSPIVVFEALLEAMASSGQSLVIPFLAGAIGFFLPGMRRRHILEAVTGD